MCQYNLYTRAEATGCARPADVDSAAIAGIMDLLRTQGCLTRSVRFGFLFGPKRTSLNYEMPAQKLFKQIGQVRGAEGKECHELS